jgi:tetratricopeptide (TPR) repeat protein
MPRFIGIILSACLTALATARAAEPPAKAPPKGDEGKAAAKEPAGPASPLAKETDPAKLIPRLGSESAAERGEALEALVALGDKAADALKAAQDNPDAEVRWRVRRALHRIHWRISRPLASVIGDLMDDFEGQKVADREMVCRDLAVVGLTAAVPTLSRVLTTDPSPAVRQAAARGLVVLGDDGLKALLDAGVRTDRLNPYTVAVRIHLGNSFLERGEYEKAIEQYQRGLEIEPKNSLIHYNLACSYSRMKKIEPALDALEKSVECGYRDVDWMEKDADLDNLRDQGRYKAIVQKLREKGKEE